MFRERAQQTPVRKDRRGRRGSDRTRIARALDQHGTTRRAEPGKITEGKTRRKARRGHKRHLATPRMWIYENLRQSRAPQHAA